MTAATLVILALAQAPPAAEPRPSACIACHSREDDESLSAPAKAFLAGDVHRERGFGCHDCHGGNPAADPDDQDAAHDEDTHGFLGAPDPTDVPELCARCHADAERMRDFNPRARIDQLAEYRTSAHGKRLAEDDTDVATCVSCHGAHGLALVKSPSSPVHPSRVAETCGHCHADAKLMARHELPTDQLEGWKKSVHGAAVARGDLAAPTCNSCHGNHGATPPGVDAVANVCGHCHTREAVLFAASPLKEPWAKLGLKECMKCHSNHMVLKPTDLMVGREAPAVCVQCHEHGEAGLGVAASVRGAYDELAAAIETGKERLDQAERMGMEVGEPRFELSTAREHLVEARVLVHSFDQGKVREKVDEGLGIARAVQEAGTEALAQLAVRRRGLAVAVALILVAMAALWLKLRDIESEPGPWSGSDDAGPAAGSS